MSDRELIASAISGAEGVSVTPYYRQSMKAGDGCVRLAQRNRAENGFGYMNVWQVWLSLPQDIATAEQWVEQNLDGLIEAVNTELLVTSVTPVDQMPGSNGIPGLIIEGSRAAG